MGIIKSIFRSFEDSARLRAYVKDIKYELFDVAPGPNPMKEVFREKYEIVQESDFEVEFRDSYETSKRDLSIEKNPTRKSNYAIKLLQVADVALFQCLRHKTLRPLAQALGIIMAVIDYWIGSEDFTDDFVADKRQAFFASIKQKLKKIHPTEFKGLAESAETVLKRKKGKIAERKHLVQEIL